MYVDILETAGESTKNQPDLFRLPLPFARTLKAHFENQATTKQCRKTDWNFSEYRLNTIIDSATWNKWLKFLIDKVRTAKSSNQMVEKALAKFMGTHS